MANSLHSIYEKKNHAYLYSHVKNASYNAYRATCNDSFTPRTMLASSSDFNVIRTRRHASHVVSHTPKDRNASHESSILFRTFGASYVIHCKNDKIVATNVGPKCKKGKTCIWVLKTYVTNQTTPNTSWGPKSQA
jgi:environmental stress-induced protein Ves